MPDWDVSFVRERWLSVEVVILREEWPNIVRLTPASADAAYLDVVNEGFFHVFGAGRFEREVATEDELFTLIRAVADGRLVRCRSRLLPFVVRAALDTERPPLAGGRLLWRRGSRYAPW